MRIESGVPVDRGELHVVRLGHRLRAGQQVAQRHAGPQRRRDELAADLVADAFQRLLLLDSLEIEQIVVGQRERILDGATDIERPLRRVHRWLDERRVDDIVVGVVRDARREVLPTTRMSRAAPEGWPSCGAGER